MIEGMKIPKSKSKIWLAIFVLALAVGAGVTLAFGIQDYGKKTPSGRPIDSQAVKIGRQLAGGKCQGAGPVQLSVSPMRIEDTAMLIPHGLMVGGHVTPIDHGYFEPKDRQAGRDAYEVRSWADGEVVQIQHRTQGPEDNPQAGGKKSEYRLVITHSCTFLTYFDLITSLAPELQSAFDRAGAEKSGGQSAKVRIPVKAGQLLGRIGGQTLDYAVWDTEKPLKGFLVPEHYKAEEWKVYTGDPFEYMTEEVRNQLLAINLRTAPPVNGKIDYDQDGRLVGNWFQQGTNYYEGDRQTTQGGGQFWGGHLAVAPHHIDPDVFVVSFGNFGGKAEQFVVVGNAPRPEEVTVESGLIKYELTQFSMSDPNGEPWNGMTYIRGAKVMPNQQVAGCALFQLTADRTLRMEPFPEQPCARVPGFTGQARTYER